MKAVSVVTQLVVIGWFPVAILCVILGIWTNDERWTETARFMTAAGIMIGVIGYGIHSLNTKEQP